jgi:hypothetical protein
VDERKSPRKRKKNRRKIDGEYENENYLNRSMQKQ